MKILKVLRIHLLPATGLFTFFITLYFLTTNQIFSFDSVTNAIACEAGEPIRWFHSNHLFYPFLGVCWYKLEVLFGYSGYSIYSLARFNSILMSGAISLLFVLLTFFVRPRIAFAVAFLFGSTYAVWFYAVDGVAVGASVLFAMLVVAQLINLNEKSDIQILDIVILVLFSTLYVLLHGIGIFHVISAMAWLIFKPDIQPRAKMYLTGVYFSSFFILLSFIYLSIYYFIVHPKSFTGFFQWGIGYAGFEGGSQIMQSSYWAKDWVSFVVGSWRGWIFTFFPPGIEIKARILSPFIAVIFLGVVVIGYLKVRGISDIQRNLFNALFIWGLLTMIFLVFWSPGQFAFRLHVLVPWIFLMGFVFNSMSAAGPTLLFGILLFSLNLSGPIYHNAFLQNNLGYQRLKEIRTHINAGDIFLAADSNFVPSLEVLLPYFFRDIGGGSITGRLYAFRERNLNSLKSEFSEALKRGRVIYVSGDILDPDVQTKIEKIRGLNTGTIGDFLRSFNVGTAFTLSSGEKVLRLDDI